VSFDGFRWDYDHDVDMPNLDTMAKDPTLPHHHQSDTFHPPNSEKLPYYATQFKNEWWDNGTLPIWITAQRQHSTHLDHSPETGQNDFKLKEVEPRFYDNKKNETKWQENVEKVMGTWFSEMDLDFVSLYFGEPDGTGHKYGPDSPERREMVKQVDRTVGYIRSLAEQNGLADSLNIIITADHGMSNVYRNGLVKEITLSRIPGFSFRDIAFHLVDFGLSGMLLPKKGMLDKVYNALKGAHPHLHVFKKEEMPKRLHFANNNRILPIILFSDPGYVINGDLEVGPFETVNIYPLMCHILGIKPDPNDGHLDATQHTLVSATEGRFISVSGILTLQRPSWITWCR
uniref:Ectonucleotide pyrophosphatase/phosphodiesterase 7 n=1 Tax=Salmo trutta TaxID=8032 RepID=A0A673XF89_SALTR